MNLEEELFELKKKRLKAITKLARLQEQAENQAMMTQDIIDGFGEVIAILA